MQHQLPELAPYLTRVRIATTQQLQEEFTLRSAFVGAGRMLFLMLSLPSGNAAVATPQVSVEHGGECYPCEVRHAK